MKVRPISHVARQFVCGKVRYGAEKRKTIAIMVFEHVARDDITILVVRTNDGCTYRFSADENGILLDNGQFVGEDDRFEFFPPKSQKS